jgi:hypothetical protein
MKLTVNGVERELFMSFGLLNEICRGVGDVQGAIAIPTNAELRDYALMVVLSERDPTNGEVITPCNLHLLDISTGEAENLLAWISEHVTDFFLRTMERVVRTQRGNEGRFRDLARPAPNPPESSTPTPTGSGA